MKTSFRPVLSLYLWREEGVVQYPVVLGDDLLQPGVDPLTPVRQAAQLLQAAMEHLDRGNKGYNLYNKILEKFYLKINM